MLYIGPLCFDNQTLISYMAERYPAKCISEAWPETELIKLRVNKSKIWPRFSTQSPLRHPVFKTEKHTRTAHPSHIFTWGKRSSKFGLSIRP